MTQGVDRDLIDSRFPNLTRRKGGIGAAFARRLYNAVSVW